MEAGLQLRVSADITDLRTKMAQATTSVKAFSGEVGPGMNAATAAIRNVGTASSESVEKISKTAKAIEHLTSADDIAAHSIRGFGRELLHLGPALAFEGLAVGVSLLAAFVTELISASDAASEFAQQQKMIAELEDQASKSAGKEAGDLAVLRGTIESTKVPMSTRLQAIKNLKAEFPTLFAGLSNEALLTGNVGAAYDLAAAAILRKARANAASGQIQEIAAKKFAILQKAEDDRQQALDEAAKARGQSYNVSTDAPGGPRETTLKTTAEEEKQSIIDRYNIRAKGYQEELDQLNHQQGFLMKYAIDGAADSIKITKDKEAATKKALTESLNADFDIYKIAQARKIRILDEGITDETIYYNERLALLRDFITESQDLINAQQKHDIDEIRKKEALDIANLNREKKKGADIAGIIKEQGIIQNNADQKVRETLAKSQDESYKLIGTGNNKYKKLLEEHDKIQHEFNQQEIDYEEWTQKQIKKARDGQLKVEHDFYEKQQKKLQQTAALYSELANSIGDSIAGLADGSSTLKDAFSAILKIIGQLIVKKGEALILLGLGDLLLPGLQAKGAREIAIGAAEVVGGSALKSFKFATGVSNFGGGAVTVGERGPELLQLPRGSSVKTNGQLNSMSHGKQEVVVYGRIDGKDIVLSSDRTRQLNSLNN